MIIENKFDIKQLVYLVTDNEQKLRIVTAIIVRETCVMYELYCGTRISIHYDYEITLERTLQIN